MIKGFLFLITIMLQTCYAINNMNMTTNSRGNITSNGGSNYIMNGGVITNPDGSMALGGSRYNTLDGQYMPLKENPNSSDNPYTEATSQDSNQ